MIISRCFLDFWINLPFLHVFLCSELPKGAREVILQGWSTGVPPCLLSSRRKDANLINLIQDLDVKLSSWLSVPDYFPASSWKCFLKESSPLNFLLHCFLLMILKKKPNPAKQNALSKVDEHHSPQISSVFHAGFSKQHFLYEIIVDFSNVFLSFGCKCVSDGC